jgi:hypothetical protein
VIDEAVAAADLDEPGHGKPLMARNTPRSETPVIAAMRSTAGCLAFPRSPAAQQSPARNTRRPLSIV